MKGSVTFDHIPTGNLRGTDKTEKADELKEFANLLEASCPSGENYNDFFSRRRMRHFLFFSDSDLLVRVSFLTNESAAKMSHYWGVGEAPTGALQPLSQSARPK